LIAHEIGELRALEQTGRGAIPRDCGETFHDFSGFRPRSRRWHANC
jgi:hypothetical protein